MTGEELTALNRLEGKVDLLIDRQTQIVTVLFDTEGNEGMATDLRKICETVATHNEAIKALATLGRDNRRWLGAITAGLITVVATVLYFFLRHIGLTGAAVSLRVFFQRFT